MAFDKLPGIDYSARAEEEERGRRAASFPREEAPSRDTFAVEQRARRQWEADPELRAEFAGRYEAWLAYSKAAAAGRVRIIGRKA